MRLCLVEDDDLLTSIRGRREDTPVLIMSAPCAVGRRGPIRITADYRAKA